jgi:uncharacterized protein (DUF302 family)
MQKLHRGLTTPVGLPFDEAVAAVREALKQEGFGVLTEIDVQQTLKEKIGAEVASHVILGACNPPLAFAALQADIDMSLLLPCNVTVRQEEGSVIVSIIDPMLMSEMSPSPDLKEVAETARGKLVRVIDQLSAK